jgi:uncharacterized membrane protein YgdD (TMEM256/DUF423 family)
MSLKIAALTGALAVALGAFGAHGLKDSLQAGGMTEIWTTAAKYHLIHAVVLLVLSLLATDLIWPPRLFLVGITIFSGSLYLMCLLHHFTGVKYGILGAITPIGGVCLIAGWVSLFFVKGL